MRPFGDFVYDSLSRFFFDRLFDEGIPLAAARATSYPFGGFVTAISAKKDGFGFGHALNN